MIEYYKSSVLFNWCWYVENGNRSAVYYFLFSKPRSVATRCNMGESMNFIESRGLGLVINHRSGEWKPGENIDRVGSWTAWFHWWPGQDEGSSVWRLWSKLDNSRIDWAARLSLSYVRSTTLADSQLVTKRLNRRLAPWKGNVLGFI